MAKIACLGCLLTFCCFVQTYAQTDSTAHQSADSMILPAVDSTNYNFFILDVRYQNRVAFMGRDFGNTIPLLASTLMYYLHSGLWIAASEYEFLKNTTIHSQVALSAGYMTEPSGKLEWNTTYTQFYIPDNRIPSSSRFQGYLQTSLGLDWKILFSTIQLQALINNNSDFFLSTTHSRYFQFNRTNKIKISFEPALSFSIGTRHFEQGVVIAAPGGGALSSGENADDATSGLVALSSDFSLPLKFEIGNLVFEPSWKFTYPFNTSYDARGIHIFSARISYYFPIRCK